jgi:hypothetical protein
MRQRRRSAHDEPNIFSYIIIFDLWVLKMLLSLFIQNQKPARAPCKAEQPWAAPTCRMKRFRLSELVFFMLMHLHQMRDLIPDNTLKHLYEIEFRDDNQRQLKTELCETQPFWKVD